jgi:arylsulfatase A-like enzyme
MPNGKPNILIIWGDDIGINNLSCYSDGLMGYCTPNIDRVANEGMRFIHCCPKLFNLVTDPYLGYRFV